MMHASIQSVFLSLLTLASATAGDAPLGPVIEAPLDVRGARDAGFAVAPVVTAVGEGVRISFTVSAPTDVEVAVLDAAGKTVRHLGAGLLGGNAPAPFVGDSLAQTLLWDRKDDAGRTVDGPSRVRVRLGAEARLEKYLGTDTASFSLVRGMVVGDGGELFVLGGSWVSRGRTELRVLDRNGNYLRTIMPYRAETPAARTASVGQLQIEGERVPIVYNGHGHNLSPLTVGMQPQNLAWNPRGFIVAASTLSTSYEHGLPRHLLAFHPGGGAPEGMDFVGPELRPPTGMTWGHGEGDDPCFEHLAASPDGQWIYYTTTTFYSKHAVYRLTWGEDHGSGMEAGWFGLDNRPGAGETQLNDPEGLAVDAAGNVYICDRGNNRVVIVSPEGGYLGSLAVEDPEQIAVHPETGDIYVLCRQAAPGYSPKDIGPMPMSEYRAWKARVAERKAKEPPRRAPKLLKLAAWNGAGTRVLAELDAAGIELIALDAGAAPAVIWAAAKGDLRRITDRGSHFEAGAPLPRGEGIAYPGRVVADPARNRVLVYNLASNYKVYAYDLATGDKDLLLDTVSDFAVAPDGSIYATGKYNSHRLLRYSADGRPLPFAGSATNSVRIAPTWIGAKNLGSRGMTVSPAGDVYLVRATLEGGVQSRLDVFGPDGSLKQAARVDGLGQGDCGVAVDRAGNIYLGVNVKPKDKPFPEAFQGKVPPANWLCWAQWSWGERPKPWYYSMRNEYLYHYGAVFKFGPQGGAFYGRDSLSRNDAGEPRRSLPLDSAPAGATEYMSGYLYHPVKVAGAIWRYAGMGIVPSSERQWGDQSCVCMTSRLAVDDFGRVFVPDCFRFSVAMLDAAGNRIARIGRYGNIDDNENIRFAWPACVDAADGLVCVSDSVNRRIAVIRLAYAAEATAPVP